METVVIVVHLMIVLALIVVVLLQRSEGGALGIGGGGGGGGGGGFMSARGAANALSRTTGILALCFFITSLTLGLLAKYNAGPSTIFDQVPASNSQQGSGNGILDQLRPQGAEPTTPEDTTQVPTGE